MTHLLAGPREEITCADNRTPDRRLQAFTNEFAALITQVLYTQPSLRPTLLRSLQTLVETSLTLSRSAAPPAELLASFGVDQTNGKANLAFLGGMTSNLLAVLFNVFSQVAREQRGMVGEVITSYLAVSSEADVTATYEKVVGHLGEALQLPTPKPAPGAAAVSPTSHTMLDLLVIVVSFLPAPAARALFAHASAAEAKLIGSSDPAVQKKSYRILARLLETGKVTLAGAELEKFVARLRDGTEVVSAGARRVSRLCFAYGLESSLISCPSFASTGPHPAPCRDCPEHPLGSAPPDRRPDA